MFFPEIARIAEISRSAPMLECELWEAGSLRRIARSLDELAAELMSLSIGGYSMEYVRYTTHLNPYVTCMWISVRRTQDMETNIDEHVMDEVALVKWAN